jgi:hypothetical protein
MGAQAARIGEQLRKEIALAIKMLALEIVRELKRATPVDTGHARRNWIASVGSRNEFEAVSDAAYEAGIAAVLSYQLADGVIWVSNVVPYIERLNNGTSTQSPAGFVEIAIDRAMTTVREKLSRKGSFIDLAPLQQQYRDEVGDSARPGISSHAELAKVDAFHRHLRRRRFAEA